MMPETLSQGQTQAKPDRPQRQLMRFRGRSYVAYVLAPNLPIMDWLDDVDATLARSPGFFTGKPVILDLAATALSGSGIRHLIANLNQRDIRVLGIEGADPAEITPEMPPSLSGGRDCSLVPNGARPVVEKAKPGSLLLDTPVRSGQSVMFAEGDVTVLGSVGSGAEIVAGGSIHIYGALRGRAMAGVNGNANARIFCNKIEAELLAIDGYYQTA